MTTATHQQNGQHWGSAHGSQAVHIPPPVGTTVSSTCQTWCARCAVIRFAAGLPAASNGGFVGRSANIRPTLAAPTVIMGCLRYADAEDTTAKVLIKKPAAVYVEQVYPYGNFAGLGIGV